MIALEHLNQLADEAKANKYPNVPTHARVKSNYSDKTANRLTHCVIDWFVLNGHFSTRLQSTGQYRDDLRKFVPSQQRAGLPDVFALVEGRSIFVEVKAGGDQLSTVQKQTILALKKSGGLVYIARDFEGFYGWYEKHVRTLLPLPVTPDQHPIPWLATPDLLPLP